MKRHKRKTKSSGNSGVSLDMPLKPVRNEIKFLEIDGQRAMVVPLIETSGNKNLFFTNELKKEWKNHFGKEIQPSNDMDILKSGLCAVVMPYNYLNNFFKDLRDRDIIS